MMSRLCTAGFAFTLLFTTTLLAQNPASAAERSTCVLEKKTYTCSLPGLRRTLEDTKTVALETDPDDKAAMKNLRHLAHELGKPVVAREDADMLLVLKAVPDNGIVYGPADQELARLQVFVSGGEGHLNQLVWSESWRGQDDRPWPLIVNALVSQFLDRLH